MDFKLTSGNAFKSKCIIFSIILINFILWSTILILYLKSFSLRNTFRNARSSFWPVYFIPNNSNDIELLTNIRLHQSQNAQNKENIQLVSSTLEVIPGTIEMVKRTVNWKDKLASTISDTEEGLKTIVNIVEFSELVDGSSSILSLLPPSAIGIPDVDKNAVADNEIDQPEHLPDEEKWRDHHQLDAPNLGDAQ